CSSRNSSRPGSTATTAGHPSSKRPDTLLARITTAIAMMTPEQFNKRAAPRLPGHLGVVITFVGPGETRAQAVVTTSLMAPNGFLHAGSIVTLADTSAGCGCLANLPDGAV